MQFVGLLTINCLQIADFGMSRDLMDETYYITHGQQIPVKWTAPEVQSNYRGFIHDIITNNVNMYEGK